MNSINIQSVPLKKPQHPFQQVVYST